MLPKIKVTIIQTRSLKDPEAVSLPDCSNPIYFIRGIVI
jgi:hypothetical protein